MHRLSSHATRARTNGNTRLSAVMRPNGIRSLPRSSLVNRCATAASHRAAIPSAFTPACNMSSSAAQTAAPARPTPTAAPSSSSSSTTSSLDFDDVSASFRVKSTPDILRSLLVFHLCGVKPLVKNARGMLNLSEKLLGRSITHWLLRQTFFGHFCAGETGEEVQVVIRKLEKSGLGGILDYAAESDIAAVPAPRDRTGINSARTYDYASEAECDANAKVCRQCIEAAGARGDGNGFAAIKLTALGKPELLEHLSKILTETKRLFLAFATDPSHAKAAPPSPSAAAGEGENPHPHPDISVSKQLITEAQFAAGLKAINVDLDSTQVKKLFSKIDKDGSGSIDYLEWISFLDPKLLGGLQPKFKSEGLPTLDQDALEKVQAMIARIEDLAELAAKLKVRLMIDAEQTYFQPAIDHVVLDLQRKYNRGTVPVIYNTYQCYLKDSYSRLLLDLERSQREKFTFAAKAVRGAYMIQERKRAKEKGYEDPIHATLQDTHDNYHAVVSKLLRHPTAEVLVASHNERTVQYVTRLMDELHIPRTGGGVYFGQLLGMCDHVSFSLGHCGYSVYKYVPYGPIHDVIPYLIRRAEENGDLLGGATKERKLLWKELRRRVTGGGGGGAGEKKVERVQTA